MPDADFIVIGAGMAGASAAYQLAAHGQVVLLEQEERPGMHTTGRSAALFLETYGASVVRSLTRASRGFLEGPPVGFCEQPILAPRGALFIAGAAERPHLEAMERELGGAIARLSAGEARGRVPILRDEACVAALYEPGAMSIDVEVLHQGFLRGFRARGGRVVAEAGVTALRREAGTWRATTGAGDFQAAVVVNAAGAWADRIAMAAGLAPLGLQPLRRTAALVDGPTGDFSSWPMVVDAAERFYFKPEAGRLMISPADETPSEPCDAQPDETDVAVAVDRIQAATTLKVRRVAHRWAGLRTFAPDRSPICGFDPRTEGFFWLAGQGGSGIKTAPALAELAAALIAGAEPPDVDGAALAPGRLFTRA